MKEQTYTLSYWIKETPDAEWKKVYIEGLTESQCIEKWNELNPLSQVAVPQIEAGEPTKPFNREVKEISKKNLQPKRKASRINKLQKLRGF